MHEVRWSSYLALGDSFTEGLWDVLDDDGSPSVELAAWAAVNSQTPQAHSFHLRGWADLLAGHLAQARGAQGDGGLRYANLAVRGWQLGQIIDEQVPQALAMKPDLVSLVGGGNDILRPAVDIDTVADRLEEAVATLRGAGIDVLLATGIDAKGSTLISTTRSKVGIFNSHIWSMARRHGAMVLDVWGMRSLRDSRMWSSDRIHLLADGHRRVAQAALVALGLEPEDHAWDDVETPLTPLGTRQRLTADAEWLREHAGPWAARRLRRAVPHDLRRAKQPDWLELDAR
ncbi:SGNH/GDSL hydrolase family protein [Serinibacter salmoneus]|uniref:Lysophospholipase L1-like esterase n=1 Tax=Serinibacter salmoneus TaxID=556530 RepID=A0A2A9D1E2_9MICO|nr:SGNH/GDSL hydrolase family protein [Serinibacter salmoneus]PFG20528.1 lysophospholipase L1-like esterase [Serinibacter salmoneus]